MLNVIMAGVIMLNVVMQSVVAPHFLVIINKENTNYNFFDAKNDLIFIKLFL
jgi:hypothetical protein